MDPLLVWVIPLVGIGVAIYLGMTEPPEGSSRGARIGLAIFVFVVSVLLSAAAAQ